MKKVLMIALLGLVSVSACSATLGQFDHSGLKKGTYIDECQHNPCTGIKVNSVSVIEKSKDYSYLKLNVLGAEEDMDSGKVTWDRNPHNIYIGCSITNPSIRYSGEVTVLPINPDSMARYLEGDVGIYMKSCHNYTGSVTDFANTFGYDVQDF